MEIKIKNNLIDKKVVVTGGCGFIGSFLVKKLLTLGVSKVIIIDNCSYGIKQNLPLKNDNISFHNLSLNEVSLDELTHVLRGSEFLFHLAAEKHNQSKDNPLDILNTNIIGIVKILEVCIRVKIKKVIFSSSLYAYGKLSFPKFNENHCPYPTTIYGISKLTGEYILNHYCNFIEYNILRYFFVYGPMQYSGKGYKSVIVKNFERMVSGEPPIINGDGLQTLDYSYVDDIVDGTISAMRLNIDKQTFNIGSGIGITIKDLIEKMKIIAKFNGKTIFHDEDETVGTTRVGDVNKAIRLLKYKPKVDLNEGLERTYDWIKNG